MHCLTFRYSAPEEPQYLIHPMPKTLIAIAICCWPTFQIQKYWKRYQDYRYEHLSDGKREAKRSEKVSRAYIGPTPLPKTRPRKLTLRGEPEPRSEP